MHGTVSRFLSVIGIRKLFGRLFLATAGLLVVIITIVLALQFALQKTL